MKYWIGLICIAGNLIIQPILVGIYLLPAIASWKYKKIIAIATQDIGYEKNF